MTETEFNALIDKAMNMEHNKFEFITNKDTYEVSKILKSSLSKVVSLFESAIKAFEEDCLKNIKQGTDSFAHTVYLKSLEDSLNYYKEEYRLVNLSLEEYDDYNSSPITWVKSFILGEERNPDTFLKVYEKYAKQ